MSTQLLPCPFCGDDGDKGRQEVTQMIEGRPKFNRITCRSCGCMCPEPNWNSRATPAHPAAGEATERADAEELRFYRRHGFPYVDHSAMFGDGSLQGLYAIKLPLSWPDPEGEGTVAAVVVRAYTVEQLYAKARGHIESIGPMPATERGAS